MLSSGKIIIQFVTTLVKSMQWFPALPLLLLMAVIPVGGISKCAKNSLTVPPMEFWIEPQPGANNMSQV